MSEQLSRIHVIGAYNEKAEVINTELTAMLQGRDMYEAEPEQADALVVVGGDGTYLYHMRELGYPDTPTIGVNAGHLGYFQEVQPDQLEYLVDSLEQQNYRVEQRSLLQIRNVGGKVVALALNDVAVKSNSWRAMKANLRVGDGDFDLFVGDGMIASTPHGSSGWAVNHGGSFMFDGIEAYQLVTMGAADSAQYESVRSPLIIPEHIPVVITGIDTDERPLVVGADGQEVEGIDPHKPIQIEVADQQLQVIHLDGHSFASRLAHTMVNRKKV